MLGKASNRDRQGSGITTVLQSTGAAEKGGGFEEEMVDKALQRCFTMGAGTTHTQS